VEFKQYLANALMADYFLISYAIEQSSGVDFLVSTAMADQYGALFSALDFQFSGYEDENYPETYMWITFQDEVERDKAEKYFSDFNFAPRNGAMILKPDIYEGNSKPNPIICDQYLKRIENFFRNDFEGYICIPAGRGDLGVEEREFMLYTKAGMQGMYKESRLFKT
jgi:hypothetical protein